MMTRSEYMEQSGGLDIKDEDRKRLHREYYSQFLRSSAIAYVVRSIGGKRIIGSADEHFNDIPLADWDRLNMIPHVDTKKISAADPCEGRNPGKFPWAKSDNVCLAKEAARQFKESAFQS